MFRVVLIGILLWSFSIVVTGCATKLPPEMAGYRAQIEEWLEQTKDVFPKAPAESVSEPYPEVIDLNDMVIVRGNGKPWESPMEWPIGGVIKDVTLKNGYLSWRNVSGVGEWPIQKDSDGDLLGGCIYVLVPLGGNRWELNFTEFIRPNGTGNNIHLERCKTSPKSGTTIKVGLTTTGAWVFGTVNARLRTTPHEVEVQ